MRISMTIIAAGSLALLSVNPAWSWEFGTSEAGDVFWSIAEDTTSTVKLAFFCSQVAPGIVLAQVATDEPGPSSTVSVELSFEVAGRNYDPTPANAESVDGFLVVTSRGDFSGLGEVARAVYAEKASIVLHYYESTWHFPGADYSDSFGAMLDACVDGYWQE